MYIKPRLQTISWPDKNNFEINQKDGLRKT